MMNSPYYFGPPVLGDPVKKAISHHYQCQQYFLKSQLFLITLLFGIQFLIHPA
jgi:hypothetical protein